MIEIFQGSFSEFVFQQTPKFFKNAAFHVSFHFMSSLVTWDVVILVSIILKTHVWLRDF